jgi:hypothetical protein
MRENDGECESDQATFWPPQTANTC